MRMFLVQSVALVALGGALGTGLAWLSLPAMQHQNPNPALAVFLAHLELDRGTLGFAALLVLGTGLLHAGLLPAWQSRAVSFNEALRSESRGASLSGGALHWQQAMVVLQSGVSVLILAGAGLAALGFYRLGRVPLGFATADRVVLQIQFPEPAYGTNEKRIQLVHALEQNLAREPALAGWGVSTTIPVGDSQWGAAFYPQLPTGEFAADQSLVHYRRVSPGYLPVMSIPLLEGRLIDAHDRADTPAVAVVSKALAEKFWPRRERARPEIEGALLDRTARPSLKSSGSSAMSTKPAPACRRARPSTFPLSRLMVPPPRLDRPARPGRQRRHPRRRAARAPHDRAGDRRLQRRDVRRPLAWQADALPRLQVTHCSASSRSSPSASPRSAAMA